MSRPIHRRRTTRAAQGVAVLACLYGVLAYLAIPDLWWLRDRDLAASISSFVTTTPQDIPGDPINVGLVGDKEEVLAAFAAAGWKAADKLTWESAVGIGLSVLLDRPYADAPVSTLLYDHRHQDMAFEKRVGVSADQRHHVRLWAAATTGPDGEPLWLGAASFDRGVGFSHDTGQITHHIGPNVDAERDSMIADLQATGRVASVSEEDGIGATDTGRNGGGDPYFTDGRIKIAVLRAEP